jgi:hypothetical protein
MTTVGLSCWRIHSSFWSTYICRSWRTQIRHVDQFKYVKMMNAFVNMTNLPLPSGDEADEPIFVRRITIQFCSRGFSFAVRVIKWLLMHLEIFGGKCVSSMKKCIFISLEKCFCTVFCEFFEFIFDCTCALADQSRNAGMLQLAET